MAKAPTESVKLGDGTVMQITRLPEVDENTWGEMKSYLERNPDIAEGLKNFSKNPDAMRGWLQTQAFAEHYQSRLESSDQIAGEQLDGLESCEELSHVFDEIRTRGMSAAMKYWDNEELLMKISERAGGVPRELQATLRRIQDTPLSLHEAVQRGDAKAVAEYIRKGQALDGQDPRGITPLCYALGAGDAALSKLLLERRASLEAVDGSGNTPLHYAAGYGHKELMEHLLGLGAEASKANAQGLRPQAVAAANGHMECADILAARSA